MLKQIRTALAQIGGLQVIAAVAAIGWGLHTLQQVADARTAQLDALTAKLEDAQAAATEPPTEPDPDAGDYVMAPSYPAPIDLDPLSHRMGNGTFADDQRSVCRCGDPAGCKFPIHQWEATG